MRLARDTVMAAQAAGVAERFAGALVAGESGAAALLFAPAGVCLSRDGTEVHGRAQIAVLLGQLTDSEHRLTVRLGRTILGERVALASQSWRRHSLPRGERFEETSTARVVLGRGVGGWEILIASLWE